MSNVFEPVRIKGKLFAKNVATGEIAAKGLIREVALRAAEQNRQVMIVNSGGRVTRMPAAEMGVVPQPQKLSFMQQSSNRIHR